MFSYRILKLYNDKENNYNHDKMMEEDSEEFKRVLRSAKVHEIYEIFTQIDICIDVRVNKEEFYKLINQLDVAYNDLHECEFDHKFECKSDRLLFCGSVEDILQDIINDLHAPMLLDCKTFIDRVNRMNQLLIIKYKKKSTCNIL